MTEVGRSRIVGGVAVPTFLYGTAWKEDATEALVARALAAGFRGIDTANQRRHYHEAGVGRALSDALSACELARDELFVQTKFTFVGGQDHRLPYDPDAPVVRQVEQSFRSSQGHLGLERIDSYVLHGPSRGEGLGAADHQAWRAMESLAGSGEVGLLGVSNVRPDQLESLIEFAEIPPAFVQNRCFARLGWDARIREICDEWRIVYQGFSLLTANPEVLRWSELGRIAERYGRTPAQIIFRFALEVGMIPLTGTTDPRHMEEDLEVYDFALDPHEVRLIEQLGS